MQHLQGQVKNILSDHAGWSSFILLCANGTEVPVYGKANGIIRGCTVDMTGDYDTTLERGEHFVLSSCSIDTNDMLERNTVNVLASGFIKGCGYKQAASIYKKFGSKTYEIIEDSPDELCSISGIREAKAKSIHDSYCRNKHLVALLTLLKPDATDGQVKKFYEKYEENAVKVIKDNPYKVADDINGIGFKKADIIAKQVGIGEQDPRRIRAAISYTLEQSQLDGQCFLMFDDLCAQLQKIVTGAVLFSKEDIKEQIRKAIKEHEVVVEKDGAIYLYSIHAAETSVAVKIRKMLNAKSSAVSENDIKKGIQTIENESNIELEALQKAAVRTAMTNPISVITGGPGVGKTTIIKTILAVWSLHHDISDVLLCAPTGRAAARMKEVTNYEARTIHSALLAEEKYGLVIVDETSMLDIFLAKSAFDLVDEGGKLVFIGDPDQLPSIGPGNFLKDIIDSNTVPCVKLKLAFRQIENSKIPINADKIRTGVTSRMFELDESFRIVYSTKDNMQESTLNEYFKAVEEYGVKQVLCACPKRQKSKIGTSTSSEDLNTKIRDKINPLKNKDDEIQGFGGKVSYRINDRVMLTKNKRIADENGKVESFANGDLGTIQGYEGVDDPTGVIVSFDDGRSRTFELEEFFRFFILAYACSIHKSQGSEYKAVVIPIASSDYIMLQRNLIYTAVTRAKEKVRIVGDGKYIDIAIRTQKAKQRNTKLKARMLMETK